jgi:hypothetical protein
VVLKRGKLVLKVAEASPKAHVLLLYLLLGDDEAVVREDGLLQVLTEDDKLHTPLVGDHTDVVQLPLGVVQKSLCLAKVVVEWGVGSGLKGKTFMVDPPVVLVAGA